MEEKLYYANASYTNSFNQMLEQMSTIADTVATQTGAISKYSDYADNPQQYQRDKDKLDQAVRKILKQEKNISSLYITFDPKKFPNRQEIWYIRTNDNEIEYVDSAKRAKTWLLKSNPNTKYFYEAMEKGSYWGGLDWETILNRYNITYTRSIRDEEGSLMGIAGVRSSKKLKYMKIAIPIYLIKILIALPKVPMLYWMRSYTVLWKATAPIWRKNQRFTI